MKTGPALTCRFLTIQLLERFASPSALEVKEVEVEGWGKWAKNHNVTGLYR